MFCNQDRSDTESGRYPLCRRIRRNFPGPFRGNPLLVSEIKIYRRDSFSSSDENREYDFR